MKVVIIGGGQVGSSLASLLLSNGHDITMVESREETFEKLQKEFPAEMLIYGNGSDPDIMKKAGVPCANVVAAVTGADETNLVISTLAKMEFGVSRVVARVNNPKNAWLFNSMMGVDIGVNQAEITSHFVVEEMDIKDIITILKLSRGDYSIVQLEVQSNAKAVNKLLKDLPVPKKTVLIAITRGDTTLIPKGDTQILEGDDILAFTDTENRAHLKELFG